MDDKPGSCKRFILYSFLISHVYTHDREYRRDLLKKIRYDPIYEMETLSPP